MSVGYRRIFIQAHAFDRDVAGEHQAIFEATLARKSRIASTLLTAHIERTGSHILASMRD